MAGAVVLAACGGSGTKQTTASGSAASPKSATTTVTSKHDSSLGTILADGKGFTLYTLTNNGTPVDCTAACAATWPPLTVTAGTVPTAPAGAGTVGMASLSDGTNVVTSGGLPLYRFVKDKDSSDAYGEGLSSFGGVWHVVKTTDSSAAAPATSPPATASARETSGY